MKPRLLAKMILALALIFATTLYARAQGETEYAEPRAGAVLCPPGIYDEKHLPPGDCEPLGPSLYLTRMAHMGITFPLKPIPAHAPDTGLAASPFFYGRVRYLNDKPAPMFNSLEAAVKGKPAYRHLEIGYSFISYEDVAVVEGKKFYMIAPGVWMTGAWVSGNVAVSEFQGLEFHGTPERPFGWVLYPVETKATPGYDLKDYTGNWLNKYDQVQVYASVRVGDQDWYHVAPDEWVVQTLVGLVFPNYDAPEGVHTGRWIEINLYEQTLAVYERNRLVFATLVSSGVNPWFTRPGLHQIYEKLDQTHMSGAFTSDRSDFYYLEDVPWTMYFDKSIALHGAYWHNGFGYPRSHGCVNLSFGDSHWMYLWAEPGDYVYVWDPSGETPLKPEFEGGP